MRIARERYLNRELVARGYNVDVGVVEVQRRDKGGKMALWQLRLINRIWLDDGGEGTLCGGLLYHRYSISRARPSVSPLKLIGNDLTH